MAIKNDNRVEIQLNTSKLSNNKEIRTFILRQWILEEPATKYRYYVDRLNNGINIYLERPAGLNKGCDFVIYIESILEWKNGNDKPPSHKYIIEDIKEKKLNLSIKEYSAFLKSIEFIYNNKSYEEAFLLIQNNINHGISYEIILKLLRWFFIEQDITYWGNSGREMLLIKIKSI